MPAAAEGDGPDPIPDGGAATIHASAVALDGRGLLILGAAGSGKSALALELMARGARLVSDDQVALSVEGGRLIARAPAAIRGRIEARFVGILNAETIPGAEVALAVDLDRTETDRLPPRRSKKLLGVTFPLLHNAANPSFPAAILQYLKAGRSD